MNQNPFHSIKLISICRRKVLFLLLILIINHLSFNISEACAQTAKVYRSGTLIGTYSTLAAASLAANAKGDSILLSAHAFYEHDVLMHPGQIWQGTLTATDTSTIDAESKGRIGKGPTMALPFSAKTLLIRDIVMMRGLADSGGAFNRIADSLVLKGHSIIRNCHARILGGAISNTRAFLFEYTQICNNSSDSFGGAFNIATYLYDNTEVSYNYAMYGGVSGAPIPVGGYLFSQSSNVRIHHNNASKAGGVVYGLLAIIYGQVLHNQAPLGAVLYHISGLSTFSAFYDAYVYNPDASGKRQNEIYSKGEVSIYGAWFGKSDTIGMIKLEGPTAKVLDGKYAIANWSVNWGKPITNKDTLLPIGAAFTYNDGTPLPTKSLPWLAGNFSSSTGKMLTPNPKITPTDTMSSLFRTYVYPTKGDTTSKPINFVCIVDGDTFRTSPRVWGIDSIKLGITNAAKETQVMVYPNPAQEVMNIQGVESGSSIELYDVMGNLRKNEKVKMNNAVLDVKLLPAGVYHLKITTKEGNVGTAKVMKD